jgi:hypothetical protein
VAHVLLWAVGPSVLLLSFAAAFAEVEPERRASRIIGLFILGSVAGAATLAAWLLGRRPRLGRRIGLVAAGGMLFVAWILTSRSDNPGGVTLFGLGLLAAGSIVAWRLWRWRPKR